MDNAKMEEKVRGQQKTLNTSADIKDDRAQGLRKKQKNIDNVVKYAGMAGTLGVGTLLSGKIKHAGETDAAIGSNFRVKQVADEREQVKNDSNKAILSSMDNMGKSSFTRTASALEAMDRGLLTSNQAKRKKSDIIDSMGGKNKDGDWKDKKLGSVVDSVITKNYPGATKPFENLDSKDSKLRKKAEEGIASGARKGTYSLELDTDTLEKTIDVLAKNIGTKDFVSQFNGIKDPSKKSDVVSYLKNSNSFESKEKLARITDMNTAFGNKPDAQASKEKALGKFSSEDLNDVFRKGSAVQQNAIKDVITNNNTTTNKIDILVNAKNELDSNSLMKRKLGL
jgi:hypothetical protein